MIDSPLHMSNLIIIPQKLKQYDKYKCHIYKIIYTHIACVWGAQNLLSDRGKIVSQRRNK